MAKKAFVYDGTNWVDIAQSTADLTNYANLTTTPISGFRNAIINGEFDIWQRGTSFTPSSSLIYTADRFFGYNSGNGSMTISRQTFTPGNTISGYEPQFYLRTAIASVGTSGAFNLGQRIEDVRKFAGQTVTVSFWMKSDASRTVTGYAYQVFGTGGSSSVTTTYGTFNVTTSWQRFTATVTIPSISGKTIGTDSYLAIELNLPVATQTTEIWGVQVEKGTVATPFEQRFIGTELALCQRYYWRSDDSQAYGAVMVGGVESATGAAMGCTNPVTMRISPTLAFGAGLSFFSSTTGQRTFTINMQRSSKTHAGIAVNITSGGATPGQAAYLYNNPAANSYVEASAEL